MAICGIVIDFDQNEEARRQTLTQLAVDSRIELGSREGQSIPAVTETPSARGDRDLWDWIGGLPGVTQVQLACAHFVDPEHDDQFGGEHSGREESSR